MILEQYSLFCTAGSSDKEYHLVLEEVGEEFVVTAYWGRRGSATQSQEKYRGLRRWKADDFVQTLLRTKRMKGYVVDSQAVPFRLEEQSS